MSKEKQTAEEVFESIIGCHPDELHLCIVDAMQEYANQQKAEMQKEIEELKEKEIKGDRRIVVLEHEKVVLQSDYKQLKQSADEMAETLEIVKECSNYKRVKKYTVTNPNLWTTLIDNALENYKKLI
jgi:osmotically-inducible protein OsmY